MADRGASEKEREQVATRLPSDPESRIRNLQSLADRMRAERDGIALERDRLQGLLAGNSSQAAEALTTAADNVREAHERAGVLEGEVATLRAELLRARFLQGRPELLPYAELLPVTNDESVLAAAADRIAAARQRDLDLLKSQLAPHGSRLPNPLRLPSKVTPAIIDQALKAARGNPQEFEAVLTQLKGLTGRER